jgi:hypothetical protein
MSHSARLFPICGQLAEHSRMILRIVGMRRRIGAQADLDHPVTLWDGKCTLMRDARRKPGSEHVADLQLTLNQRVQSSSPWALTPTTYGICQSDRSHILSIMHEVQGAELQSQLFSAGDTTPVAAVPPVIHDIPRRQAQHCCCQRLGILIEGLPQEAAPNPASNCNAPTVITTAHGRRCPSSSSASSGHPKR